MIAAAFLTVALSLPSTQFPSSPKHIKIELVKLQEMPRNEEQWWAVHNYAIKIIHIFRWKHNAVEDMAQDTVLKLMEAIDAGVPITHVSGYISGIVRNVMKIHIARYHTKDMINVDYVPVADDKPLTDDQLFDSQREELGRDAIAYALERISLKHNIIMRHYLAGFNRTAIIRRMKLTETQYRLNLSRGKQALIREAKRYLKRSA